MDVVTVSPETVSGDPSVFSIRFVTVAVLAPAGRCSFTSPGWPAHSYMRMTSAFESSAFFTAVKNNVWIVHCHKGVLLRK